MNPRKILLIVFIALLFGYGTGVLGTMITQRQQAGSAASSHELLLDWLIAPAFPGLLAAEMCTGCEWHPYETWSSGRDVRLWNAGFWGLAAMVITVPSAFGGYFRRWL